MRRVIDDTHFEDVVKDITAYLRAEEENSQYGCDVYLYRVIDRMANALGLKFTNEIAIDDGVRFDIVYITPEEEQICGLIKCNPKKERFGESLNIDIYDIDSKKEYGNFHFYNSLED